MEANGNLVEKISLLHIHKVTVLCISFHTVIAREESEHMLVKCIQILFFRDKQVFANLLGIKRGMDNLFRLITLIMEIFCYT